MTALPLSRALVRVLSDYFDLAKVRIFIPFK